ncbi:hypothetical protein Ccrd_011981 [Cynara cardunculus var. scolymus]|uniref:PGG domain-containing protein n=1 Tax=Cynara cardunculus var. scolymus TaxID=59895 RepID=A0A118K5U1_CYNCS|nr:hypothetical protein Ccrd_011981 [Cynara cardunculus var. scolymus]
MALSSSKYPHPIYMDFNFNYIPKLDEYTVDGWKIIMNGLLKNNGVIGYIDGSIEPPPDGNPDYAEWKEIDNTVRDLIISAIGDDFLKKNSCLITTPKTAKDLIPLTTRVMYTGSNKAEMRSHYLPYLPLHKAAVKGDMKTLDEILKKNPNAVRALVTGASETALMVASPIEGNQEFLKKLISLMSPEDLAMQDSFGQTALSGAILAGDVDVMKLMVEKNPDLPHIRDMYNLIPLFIAPYSCDNDAVVRYLLDVTNESYLRDPQTALLVAGLIYGGFFDLCFELLDGFPFLAVTPLEILTLMHSAFLSGTKLNSWQSFIYSHLPEEELKNYSGIGFGDVENPREEIVKVPEVKRMQEFKRKHAQALVLLKRTCYLLAQLPGKVARDIIGSPLETAAANGNVEVVEEILTTFPNAIYLQNRSGRGVFHIAIANRRAKVFNLIYQTTNLRRRALQVLDNSQNTALHLAAHLAGETENEAGLNLRSTGPAVIFNETHEQLAKEGEQWMKDRANSGLIVATLIATIVFTSAITIPGGNNSNTGLPVFSQRPAFVVFAVSDALALFMSVSSILLFLGILTARYAIEDFLYSLPKRLMLALITLFVSIMCMMIAFTAILYLVFGDEKRWVLGLVSSLAAMPLLLFALLQFKPLLDIITSTYWLQIFKKQGDNILF